MCVCVQVDSILIRELDLFGLNLMLTKFKSSFDLVDSRALASDLVHLQPWEILLSWTAKICELPAYLNFSLPDT